jgi:hypothetical protein
MGSGLAFVAPGARFAVTDDGRNLTAQLKGGVISQVFEVERRLEGVLLDTVFWVPPPGAYERAVDRYHRRWRWLSLVGR